MIGWTIGSVLCRIYLHSNLCKCIYNTFVGMMGRKIDSVYCRIYRIAGFFRGRKLSRILRFCGDSRKLSPLKSIFKQLDTVLVGVMLGYHKFVKVLSAKIYFQAIRYRASGRGALDYCKFAKVFSAKIYFQAICERFLQ